MTREIKGKKVCVIGGAGSIGSSFIKAQAVEAIKEFIPNFEHEEKGKNLDQKM